MNQELWAIDMIRVENLPIFIIYDDDLIDNSSTPLVVRVRLELEKQGMVFEDTGKLSSISNEYPIPLGTIITHKDFDRRATLYKQILDETNEHPKQTF